MDDSNKDPKRNFSNNAMTLGLFSDVGCLSFMQVSRGLSEVPDKLPDDRSIYKLQGQVIVDGQRADINSTITAGSRVETGPNGSIIFVVGDDVLVLGNSSELELSGDGTADVEYRYPGRKKPARLR